MFTHDLLFFMGFFLFILRSMLRCRIKHCLTIGCIWSKCIYN